MSTVINTHKLFNALKESGFNEKQANEILNTVEAIQDARLEEVATKSDIVRLETRQEADSKITHWGIALVIAVLVLPYLKQLLA